MQRELLRRVALFIRPIFEFSTFCSFTRLFVVDDETGDVLEPFVPGGVMSAMKGIIYYKQFHRVYSHLLLRSPVYFWVISTIYKADFVQRL